MHRWLFQRFFVWFGWFENPRVLNSVSHENLGIFVAFMHRVPANIFLCKIMLFEILKISTNRPHVPSDRVGCIRSISGFNWRIIHGNTLLWLTETNLLGPRSLFFSVKNSIFFRKLQLFPMPEQWGLWNRNAPYLLLPSRVFGRILSKR